MAHVLACARVPARSVWALMPPRYYESLEQNQQLLGCCRHPENHDIEAFYSNEAERWRDKDPMRDMPNPPDIYIFHCPCGRKHRRFCVGNSEGFKRDGFDFVRDAEGKPVFHTEHRPFWEVN
jgi:hypothetical protein